MHPKDIPVEVILWFLRWTQAAAVSMAVTTESAAWLAWEAECAFESSVRKAGLDQGLVVEALSLPPAPSMDVVEAHDQWVDAGAWGPEPRDPMPPKWR